MSIGYACIALGVREGKLKRCILNKASEDKLRDVIDSNLSALESIINYNIKNGVKLFRISSDIIPFASHPINQIKWWEDYEDKLLRIGERIKKGNIRVSMHPGQYSVLNSNNSEVVSNAIKDLEYHNRLLDKLNVDKSCKIVLHVGGVYGNKQEALERFCNHYDCLDEKIKQRLIIENDERCYNIEDVLNIGVKKNIPVVFDILHHQVNLPKKDLNYVDWIKLSSKTWNGFDGKQKVHYSEQSKTGRIGAHSSTVSINEFLSFYNKVKDLDIDIMLETKDKNLSCLKCIYSTQESIPRKYIEKEWARYKYLVMSKSYALYREVSKLFKDEKNAKDLSLKFYRLIEKAQCTNYSKSDEENTALHIWGYFKKFALEKEKKLFFEKLEKTKSEDEDIKLIKKYLYKLADKYEKEYLLRSHYFLGY
ncbi:UV DNA damage repair endonuclease UvsE [Herbivorax sp. ANBcel31]|uniref:UV DNA damage repair endonuclease UvsE n=1 Tax=Herbivorax sp. ANBcel31 TaxID=3069754 RepID=UPI0027B3CEAC|nr:UV DNA damage repair endonuclease UvsE [Herbivorax sp. ANBcel31]MDQ2086244.1 UV DNA damage repair endonuclease UvsE [Herbivorax sp. ANBcel31]